MCLDIRMKTRQHDFRVEMGDRAQDRSSLSDKGQKPREAGLQSALVVTVREAARLLRCSEETVYQLIYSGQLRALRPSRRFIIPCSAIDAFLGGSCKP
jgi:excisionase family DNA binding protein